VSADTTADIYLGRTGLGSTKPIELTFKLDGEPWAGIDSVTLTFESPDRETQFDRAMTLVDDAAGLWRYTPTTAEFSAGDWTASPLVTDGAHVERYPDEISFTVTDQP
jgi:hypothetical protein